MLKYTFTKGERVPSHKISAHIKEIEAIISRVKGVISSQVVCENNDIVEIHVLADHSRTPKQIVRDIESATLLKLGTALDHKQISVAQLGGKGTATFAPGTRFRLEKINYSTDDEEVEITIKIKLGEEMFTASSSGPNTKQYRLRLVAETTLSAVEQYLDSKNRLMAAAVQKINIAGQEVIVVVVSLCIGPREEILPGSALNRGDEMEATVRATLDTINRRLFTIERI